MIPLFFYTIIICRCRNHFSTTVKQGFRNLQYILIMFEWCKNFQSPSANKNEVTLHPFIPSTNESSDFINQQSKFSIFSSVKIRKPTNKPRKGITLHFHKSLKEPARNTLMPDSPIPKRMVNSSTQTSRILLCNTIAKQNNVLNESLQLSPVTQPQINKIQWKEPNKQPYLQQSPCESMKKPAPIDLTKTSKHIQDTNSQLWSNRKTSFPHVTSPTFLIPLNNRSYKEELSPINQKQARFIENSTTTRKINFEVKQHQPFITFNVQEQESSHQEKTPPISPLRPRQSTISEKYKNLCRNVQSEFKISQAKYSQVKIRQSPQRRLLFDRQTIKSKYDCSDESFRIEESIICEPQIRSYFTPLDQSLKYDSYQLTLTRENSIGIAVTLKEIPSHLMTNISQQLFIYKELEDRGKIFKQLLALYQTQIEIGLYIFIKEPFTETVRKYVKRERNIGEIEKQLYKAFEEAEQYGLQIKIMPKLQDFVMIFGELKIENASIFGWENQVIIDKEQAILNIRSILLQQLL